MNAALCRALRNTAKDRNYNITFTTSIVVILYLFIIFKFQPTLFAINKSLI